jgi:hypothetical protein
MSATEISEANSRLTEKLENGTVNPETALAQVAISRTEIMAWRVRMEYARHHGKTVKIRELEPEKIAA